MIAVNIVLILQSITLFFERHWKRIIRVHHTLMYHYHINFKSVSEMKLSQRRFLYLELMEQKEMEAERVDGKKDETEDETEDMLAGAKLS